MDLIQVDISWLKVIEGVIIAIPSLLISLVVIHRNKKNNNRIQGLLDEANDLNKNANKKADEANRLADNANKLSEQAIHQINEQAQKTQALREQANFLTERINSKEHEISENLKFEILNIISIVRSIDSKVVNNSKPDITQEIDLLINLQSKPEYLLFLKSIQKDDDRIFMEERLRLLTMPSMPINFIRYWTHSILDALKKQVNLDEVVKQISEDYNNNWNQLVKDLCEMRGIFTAYDANAMDKMIKARNRFLYGFFSFLLEKKYQDPNINMWIAMTSPNGVNQELLFQAMQEGADREMSDTKMIKKYQMEFNEFKSIYRDED